MLENYDNKDSVDLRMHSRMALQNIRIVTSEGDINVDSFVSGQYSPFTELRENTKAVMEKVNTLVGKETRAKELERQRKRTLVEIRLENNTPVHTYSEVCDRCNLCISLICFFL